MPAGQLAFFWIAMIAAYAVVWLTSDPVLVFIGEEDGPVESVGAGFFLGSSLLFVYACYLSASPDDRFLGWRTGRNVHFLLLAALCFVAFGEEISWGQRVFGWSTPDTFADLNAQGETNLHNLWFLQRTEDRSFLELLINPQRLLNIFCGLYAVVLPILYANWSRARQLVDWAGVPVPSVAVGILFVVNYVLLKVSELALSLGLLTSDAAAYEALDELSEAIVGAVFFVLAASFVAAVRSKAARPQRSPLVGAAFDSATTVKSSRAAGDDQGASD